MSAPGQEDKEKALGKSGKSDAKQEHSNNTDRSKNTTGDSQVPPEDYSTPDDYLEVQAEQVAENIATSQEKKQEAKQPDNVNPAEITADSQKKSAGKTKEKFKKKDKKSNNNPAASNMPLGSHLHELRKRIVRAFLSIIVGFFICYAFHVQLGDIIYAPLINALPEGKVPGEIIFTGLPEAFLVYLKISFFAGIFLMSPYIFYQVWAFIAPGLYDEEKIYIIPIALLSALCFISGALFCYFVVFPNAFRFFMSFSNETFKAKFSMSEYFGLTLQLILAFGLIFELPLFTLFLSRMGIITADMMRKFRRYSIVLAFIIGAVLTPPDVISQLLMAGPILVLYEVSILIAAAVGKNKKQKESEAA